MIFIFAGMFLLFFIGMPIGFGILSSTILYLIASGQSRELISFAARVNSASDAYVLLAVPFFMLAAELMNEAKITEELLAAQGRPVDVGGYYLPDDSMAEKAMRPSPTFNAIIDGLGGEG